MSRNYDNWERLVAAVLKKEQLWQLFHAQSTSPSISSGSSGTFSFSFNLASSLDDVPFGFSSPDWSAYNHKEDDFGTKTDKATPSGILVEDQSPVENPSSNKNLTFTRFWKRALNIQVPKRQNQHYGAFNQVERSVNSPKISPQNTSPSSSSRVHPRTGGGQSPQTNSHDNSKQESHPLPLPPEAISNSPPFTGPRSAATSPSTPLRSPEKAESVKSPALWKKGKFLGRGACGGVYLGFNSEKGEMCAMKEFDLSLDESKQGARMLRIEISLLSSLKHPNIVQYYGSEMVGDNFYIFNEYMSGGSIHTILQEYGKLGESAIRSYTQQILLGLSYLHSKSISHSNISAATILVDPNGKVKLTNFGIEKRIIGQNHPSVLVDGSYWMAPEVIINSSARNLATDIWSLGCTIIEMATSKPPNCQYTGAIAMFKVAYHREVPTIPNHLSDECKDFLRRCLKWNPRDRATAAQLLEHPFVKSSSPLEKQIPVSTTSSVHHLHGIRHTRSHHQFDSGRLAVNSSRASKSNFYPSDIHTPRNTSAPVSPVRSPPPHPRSPQTQKMHTSPPTISRSRTPAARTSGIGAIPYSHLPNNNSPPYWDPKILKGVNSGFHDFQEPTSSDNNALQKQQIYEQLNLADRVSQQLLKPRVARV